MRIQGILFIGILVWTLDFSMVYAQEHATYKSVLAEDKKLGNSRELNKHFETIGDSPDFLIEKGELFLKIQDTHTKWWFAVVVNHPRWSSEELSALQRDHPEVVSLLPDPSSPTGGIAWLEEE